MRKGIAERVSEWWCWNSPPIYAVVAVLMCIVAAMTGKSALAAVAAAFITMSYVAGEARRNLETLRRLEDIERQIRYSNIRWANEKINAAMERYERSKAEPTCGNPNM